MLLWETMRVTDLGRGLARWRAPRAVHDPGKIVADHGVPNQLNMATLVHWAEAA